MAITKHVYQIFIKATPEQVWDAIIEPSWTRRYFHGTAFDSHQGAVLIFDPEHGGVAAAEVIAGHRARDDVQIVFDLLDLHGLDRRSRGSLSLAGHDQRHDTHPDQRSKQQSSLHDGLQAPSGYYASHSDPGLGIRDSGFGARPIKRPEGRIDGPTSPVRSAGTAAKVQ